MDGNKDEASRCLGLARQAFDKGSLQQALRLCEKSVRLYPSQAAEDLSGQIREAIDANGWETVRDVFQAEEQHVGARDDEGMESEEDDVAYTEQQAAAVRKIIACKDYYEVLGVSKDATETDLKKAYRRLALQFHPDKNQAPGADDAFKSVSNAFTVLSDPEKRRRYDQFGHEDPQHSPSAGPTFSRQFFGEEISPDEVFNMFFKAGFSKKSSDGRRSRTAEFFYTTDSDQSMKSELLRLAPLAVILTLTILSSMLTKWHEMHQVYHLTKTSAYPVERVTENTEYKIKYYVTPSFENDLLSWDSLSSFETYLENSYISDLESSCSAQKTKQKRDLSAAKFHGDEYRAHEVRRRILPSCDTLWNLPVNKDYDGGWSGLVLQHLEVPLHPPPPSPLSLSLSVSVSVHKSVHACQWVYPDMFTLALAAMNAKKSRCPFLFIYHHCIHPCYNHIMTSYIDIISDDITHYTMSSLLYIS